MVYPTGHTLNRITQSRSGSFARLHVPGPGSVVSRSGHQALTEPCAALLLAYM